MHEVLQGHCDPRFDKVAEALGEEITTGEEVGAAIAIDIDGELVVDIWGGHADAAKTVPWGEDTIVNVFSSTKNITALAGLMLIDRGLVEPSAAVANYWPEFAANGKQDIEFRHLLSHSSGLSGWDAPFTNRGHVRLGQVDSGAGRAGTVVGTGHRIGLPRADLRSPDRRGVTPGHRKDVEGLRPRRDRHPAWRRLPDRRRYRGHRPHRRDRSRHRTSWTCRRSTSFPRSMVKTLIGPPPDPNLANTAAWRAADMGAVNGHGERSVTRPHPVGNFVGRHRERCAAVAAGNGRHDLRRTDRWTRRRAAGHPVRRGLGFGLPQLETFPFVPEGKICFWGGWGGSWEMMDPDRRATVTYVMNKMAPGIEGSDRTARYFNADLRGPWLSPRRQPVQHVVAECAQVLPRRHADQRHAVGHTGRRDVGDQSGKPVDSARVVHTVDWAPKPLRAERKSAATATVTSRITATSSPPARIRARARRACCRSAAATRTVRRSPSVSSLQSPLRRVRHE